MHDSRTERYVVGETLDATTASTTPDFTSCYEFAESHRSELSSLLAAIESEREQAKAARAMMIPHLELYGVILSSNPNTRYFPLEDKFHTTWEVGGRINYSPNELALGRAQARQHRARAESLIAQRQQLLERIRDEVLAAVQARQESVLALTAAAKSLAVAEDSYRIRKSLFAEGRSASVELTDAESDLVRARFAEVDARIDARLASVRLEGAMGVLREPRH
jgi:outer membrane protein TolC